MYWEVYIYNAYVHISSYGFTRLVTFDNVNSHLLSKNRTVHWTSRQEASENFRGESRTYCVYACVSLNPLYVAARIHACIPQVASRTYLSRMIARGNVCISIVQYVHTRYVFTHLLWLPCAVVMMVRQCEDNMHNIAYGVHSYKLYCCDMNALKEGRKQFWIFVQEFEIIFWLCMCKVDSVHKYRCVHIHM